MELFELLTLNEIAELKGELIMIKLNYFKDCKNLKEVKDLYRSLAMQHHPDKSGDTAIMQEINNEYEYIYNTRCFEEDKYNRYNDIMLYRDTIEQLINFNFDDTVIEVIGRWLWVYGDI